MIIEDALQSLPISLLRVYDSDEGLFGFGTSSLSSFQSDATFEMKLLEMLATSSSYTSTMWRRSFRFSTIAMTSALLACLSGSSASQNRRIDPASNSLTTCQYSGTLYRPASFRAF